MTKHRLFLCEPINGTRISRESCGARHLEARRNGAKGKIALITGTCAKCSVGAAHARGEVPRRWDDGSKVREVNVVPRTGTEKIRVQP